MVMLEKSVRLCALLATICVVLTGCRSCVRESVVWQHTFRSPAQKECPPLRPEYELPPGGPYLEKPSGKGFASKAASPQKTSQEITVAN